MEDDLKRLELFDFYFISFFFHCFFGNSLCLSDNICFKTANDDMKNTKKKHVIYGIKQTFIGTDWFERIAKFNMFRSV